MKALEKLSGNELSELICLYDRIQYAIERDYRHVSDFMPERLKRDIKNAQIKTLQEYERRYLSED